jgi:hypothetical protein
MLRKKTIFCEKIKNWLEEFHLQALFHFRAYFSYLRAPTTFILIISMTSIN